MLSLKHLVAGEAEDEDVGGALTAAVEVVADEVGAVVLCRNMLHHHFASSKFLQSMDFLPEPT
jgi:hypothetical protein